MQIGEVIVAVGAGEEVRAWSYRSLLQTGAVEYDGLLGVQRGSRGGVSRAGGGLQDGDRQAQAEGTQCRNFRGRCPQAPSQPPAVTGLMVVMTNRLAAIRLRNG